MQAKVQIVGLSRALCPIPLGFSGQMRGNVPANPRGWCGKCGGFLPVLRFQTLQTFVTQGTVVRTWRGGGADGMFWGWEGCCRCGVFSVAARGGKWCWTGTFRLFTAFSAFSFSSSLPILSGQTFDRLVTVRFICCHTSTPVLSAWCSSRGLILMGDIPSRGGLRA